MQTLKALYGRKQMIEINIGSGDYIISNIRKGPKDGIRISSLPKHGQPCDAPADHAIKDATPICNIWFDTLAAARLFQDQVNTTCLRMNGYVVQNAEVEGREPEREKANANT